MSYHLGAQGIFNPSNVNPPFDPALTRGGYIYVYV